MTVTGKTWLAQRISATLIRFSPATTPMAGPEIGPDRPGTMDLESGAQPAGAGHHDGNTKPGRADAGRQGAARASASGGSGPREPLHHRSAGD
jgi:hypothetical protein